MTRLGSTSNTGKKCRDGKNTSLHPLFFAKYLIYNTWRRRCGMQAGTRNSSFDSTLICFPLVIRDTLFVDLFYSWHQFGRNPQSHVSQVYCPFAFAWKSISKGGWECYYLWCSLLSNCLPSFTIPAQQTVAFGGWIDGVIFLHPKVTARIS